MPARKPAWQACRPTPRGTGVGAPVFHEIPRAAGPLQQAIRIYENPRRSRVGQDGILRGDCPGRPLGRARVDWGRPLGPARRLPSGQLAPTSGLSTLPRRRPCRRSPLPLAQNPAPCNPPCAARGAGLSPRALAPSSAGAKERSPRREPWEDSEIDQAPVGGARRFPRPLRGLTTQFFPFDFIAALH